jgi:tRNA pseudouridine38-40 synthase
LVVPNIKAIVEYDGTDFSGFQRQSSRRTIQGEIERALAKLFKEESHKIIGAGRTDAGVHATGQVVSFQIPETFPEDKIVPAVNGLLPISIRVRSAQVAPDEFHARYSAKSRTYVYVALCREEPTALLTRYVWHVRTPIDTQAMSVAAQALIGRMDFASFGLPDRTGGNTVRRVQNLEIRRRKDMVFCFIKADAFLRGMVRAVVGTLVEVGAGKRSPDTVAEILAACDRRACDVSAPSRGLYLSRVEY